jgi:hypothetical protein
MGATWFKETTEGKLISTELNREGREGEVARRITKAREKGECHPQTNKFKILRSQDCHLYAHLA